MRGILKNTWVRALEITLIVVSFLERNQIARFISAKLGLDFVVEVTSRFGAPAGHRLSSFIALIIAEPRLIAVIVTGIVVLINLIAVLAEHISLRRGKHSAPKHGREDRRPDDYGHDGRRPDDHGHDDRRHDDRGYDDRRHDGYGHDDYRHDDHGPGHGSGHPGHMLPGDDRPGHGGETPEKMDEPGYVYPGYAQPDGEREKHS